MRNTPKTIVCLLTIASLCFGLCLPTAAELTYRDFAYEIVGDSVTITGYNGALESVTLPLTIDGRPVTAIGDRAFQSNAGLRYVSLADEDTSYLETIGTQSFAGCTSLVRVSIPGSVTTVGDFAFSGCRSLTEASISSAGTTLGICAFSDCVSLKAVSVPCYRIGYGAFSGCTALSDVHLSASVRAVGQNAFADTALWRAYDNGPVYIDSLLYACKGKTERVVIREGTYCVADYAFAGAGLKQAILPESLYRIGAGAFADNPELTYLSVPASVTAIGEDAFATGSGSFTLYCRSGSEAESYARLHGVAYETTDDCVHVFSDWTTTRARSCEDDGLRYRRCIRCNAVEEEVIPATGHNFSKVVTHPEATCTTDGRRTKTCENCGVTLTETIPAPGHDWSDWSVMRKPTCAAAGIKTRTCAVCGVQDAEVIETLPHTWIVDETTDADGFVILQEPTCVDPGARRRVCAECGGAATEAIPALGHSVTEWRVAKPPTAATKGVESGACDRCGATVTRYTDKLPSVLPKTAYRLELENGSELMFGTEFTEHGEGYLIAPANMTIGDCMLNLKNSGFLIVTNALGERYEDTDALIGTGMIISLVQDTSAKLDNVNVIDYSVVLVVGDVSGDGRITAGDARTALRISAKLENTTMIGFRACDLNGDERVFAVEARTILRVSARLETFDGTTPPQDEPATAPPDEPATLPPEEHSEETL